MVKTDELKEAIAYKEELVKSILPLQRTISYRKRKKWHEEHFSKKPQTTTKTIVVCLKLCT